MQFIAFCKGQPLVGFLTNTNLGANPSLKQKGNSARVKHIIRVMKLVTALLFIGCLHLSAKTVSQTITLSGKDLPLEYVFAEIERQTGYMVLSSDLIMKKANPVTISVTNETVEDFIRKVLKYQPFTYMIKDKTISVRERSPNRGFDPKGLLSSSLSLKAPPITIRGRVIDGNAEGLEGISITVQGSNKGTTTDSDGYFELHGADAAGRLVITGVSIETKEVILGGKPNIGNIVVQLKIETSEEVVVGTSYTTTLKRKSTSSIVKVTAKEIERQPVTSPLMSLQGRVPGLEVIPSSGSPGAAPRILIRGHNSLRRDGGYPLYVVDGVFIESVPVNSVNQSFLAGGIDPLSSINPAEIESIEILKDADATAIYGSRGANGVIIIKTKQAKLNESTNLNLNGYAGIGKIGNTIDLLNTQQYLGMRREAFRNDGVTPDLNNATDLLYWDTSRYTDWQHELLGGAAHITDLQAILTGGNENTSFRFSGGYHKETLIFPGAFSHQLFRNSFSVNHSSTNKKFRASLNSNYGFEKSKLFDDPNFMSAALSLSPNAPRLYDHNGDINWAPWPDGSSSFLNPLALLEKENHSAKKTLISNAVFSYALVPGLLLKANLGFTTLHFDEHWIDPIRAATPESRSSTLGRATFITSNRSSWVIEPQLSYEKAFGDHALVTVAGSTFQNSASNYQAIYASNYANDALLGSIMGAGRYSPQESISRYKYLSFFARTQYCYNDRYLLSLTARRDGSSRFGPGKRFGDFYSVAGAWIFSNDKWVVRNMPFISFGKLRSSYGMTGNDQIGDYKYLNTFSFGGIYQENNALVSSALFNPDFSWEVTKKLEGALELGLRDGRIAIEINWYRNISSNQLIDYQLPATTGFPSVLSNLNATILNTGWEATLSTVNVKRKKIKWTTSANLSFPKNRLFEFRNIESSTYNKTYKVGEPLSIQRVYLWYGVDSKTGLHTFMDVNGDGRIDDADKVFANPRERTFFGGLLNTFQYADFELSFLIQFSKQRGSKFLPGMPGISENQPVQSISNWKMPGDLSRVQKFSQRSGGNIPDNPAGAYENLLMSTYNQENASFARLKTLSLSYHFPVRLSRKFGLSTCRIFLQGQNVFTMTKYVNLDPETESSLPPLKMYTLGLDLKL